MSSSLRDESLKYRRAARKINVDAMVRKYAPYVSTLTQHRRYRGPLPVHRVHSVLVARDIVQHDASLGTTRWMRTRLARVRAVTLSLSVSEDQRLMTNTTRKRDCPYGVRRVSRHSSASSTSALGPSTSRSAQGRVAVRAMADAGPKLTYIEGWKVVDLANEVFGFNGWSTSVTSLDIDYVRRTAHLARCAPRVGALQLRRERNRAHHTPRRHVPRGRGVRPHGGRTWQARRAGKVQKGGDHRLDQAWAQDIWASTRQLFVRPPVLARSAQNARAYGTCYDSPRLRLTPPSSTGTRIPPRARRAPRRVLEQSARATSRTSSAWRRRSRHGCDSRPRRVPRWPAGVASPKAFVAQPQVVRQRAPPRPLPMLRRRPSHLCRAPYLRLPRRRRPPPVPRPVLALG